MPSRTSKSRKTSISQSSALRQNDYKGQFAISKSTVTSTVTNPPNPLPSTSTSTTAFPPPKPTPPPNWPSNLPYLSHPILSPYLPPTHLKWLRIRPSPSPQSQFTSTNNNNSNSLPIIPFPLSQTDIQSRVNIRVIDDPRHPAHGQRGLLANRDLAPDELVVVYLGYVHGSTAVERAELERMRLRARLPSTKVREGDLENVKGQRDGEGGDNDRSGDRVDVPTETGDYEEEECMIGSWDTSSYDLNMYRGETIEIAVDAAKMGNEARFVNDYRGVPVSISFDRTQQSDEASKDRRGKRKVKSTQSTGDHQTGSAGDGEEWQKYNNDNIAMPNAEFRDVWFDTPEEGDLTYNLSSDAGFSDSNAASASAQERYTNGEPPVNAHASADTPIPSAPSIENLNLNEPLSNQTNHNSRNSGHGTLTSPSHLPSRRKRKPGIRGVAIFVMPAGKSGKRKGGIKKGQEILVSYGKGFWAHHGSGS